MMDFLASGLPAIMLTALVVLMLSGYPVALVLAGVGVVFALIGLAVGVFPAGMLQLMPLRIFGNIAESLLYPPVPMLIFLGYMLEGSGIAVAMLTKLRQLLRFVPGSVAVSVLLIGAVLAPVAGMLGASVTLLAAVALPSMLDRGYSPSLASGVIAASGTLGIIIPPAVMLFFLADLFGAQISAVFLGMLAPAGILLVAYSAYVILHVRAAPNSLLQRQGATEPQLAMPSGWSSLGLLLLLLSVVLGSILFGLAAPSEAAACGAAGAVGLTLLNRTFSWQLLRAALVKTTLTSAMIFAIVGGATTFSLPFRYMGGDDLVVNAVRGLGLGDGGTLGLIMLLIFVMGFFFDWIEILLISLTILMPVISQLQFDDYVGVPGLGMTWIAILIALNLHTSFLTPPFGFALFFLRGAAPPEVTWRDIYVGVAPFLAIQLAVIGTVALFPSVALKLPDYLLK